MNRQKIKPSKPSILRALFARSGNQCAFPGCAHPLVNAKEQIVGQVCHIEAASPGGKRYNPKQTNEERRGYDNLILLCHAHHVEVDSGTDFSVAALKKMKTAHEESIGISPYQINESALAAVVSEMDAYWTNIEKINKFEHIAPPDIAFPIDAQASFFRIMESCRTAIGHVEEYFDAFRTSDSDEQLKSDLVLLLRKKGVDARIFDSVPYYDNPFCNRNWESHYLGVPNAVQKISIDLMQAEIKYLEIFVQINKGDRTARMRLENLKKKFSELAKTAGIRD